jgi:probable HAF family extracellular repeat protein
VKSRTLTCITAITLFALLALPLQLSAQHTRYNLIDIGTLGGPAAHGPGNGAGSQQINNAGVVVGTADTSTQDPDCGCFVSHGFRWLKGLLTDLGALAGGKFSGANAINARGWIVGFSQTSEVDPVVGGPTGHAVLWKDNAINDLGTLGTGVESAALYVKNGGQVVGGATIDTSSDPFAFAGLGPFGSPTHAFTWKNGVMRDIGTLGGPDSFAAGGCNNQRGELVVGGSFTNSTANSTTGIPTLHAFLWKNGTMTDIPTLGGTFAFAQCTNNQAQVIGQSSFVGDVGCNPNDLLNTCDEHAFSWNHGITSDLGTLGGSFSTAFWLNEKGEAVGGALTSDDESFHATLWRNGQITDLGTLDGDCASIAWAINAKSQTVGQSFNCDTNTSETVLWDKGAIIDLQLASADPLNINDRGEITGVQLPAGCDDTDVCGRAFLLIPCASGQGCEGTRTGSPAVATRAAISAERRRMIREFVARLRARIAQRDHSPAFGVLRHY